MRLPVIMNRLTAGAEERGLDAAQIAEVHARFGEADLLVRPHTVIDDEDEPEGIEPAQQLARARARVGERGDHAEDGHLIDA